MSKKGKNQFTAKAGNPAKRAEELNLHKEKQHARIQSERQAIAYSKRLVETSTPQNVGSMYQPPAGLEPIENVRPPAYKAKSKTKSELIKKIGGGLIVLSALGALVASTIAPMIESNVNQRIMEEQQLQQQQLGNPNENLVDKNGNRILVDSNGNPIGGTKIAEFNSNDETNSEDTTVKEETPKKGETTK